MVKPANADEKKSMCGLSIEIGIWIAAVFAFIEIIIELRIVLSYWPVFALIIIKLGLILNIALTLKCDHAHHTGPIKSSRAAFWIYVIVIVLDTCLYLFVMSWALKDVKDEKDVPESCSHVHDVE